MKNIYYLITLLSFLFLQSCSVLRPQVDLSVSTDTRALEFLQERSWSINSFKAELYINPTDIAMPSIDAYLSYDRAGLFRLIGLSSAGFTLFDLKIEDGVVTGPVNNLPANEIFTPEMLREVIDFYGSSDSADFVWFMEELRNYYVVNQLISSGGISYPLRRWWIDKDEMLIVKKELYSKHPDKPGVIIFESLYRDFRAINGIMTPGEIIIINGYGNKIGKIRYKKIKYNEEYP